MSKAPFIAGLFVCCLVNAATAHAASIDAAPSFFPDPVVISASHSAAIPDFRMPSPASFSFSNASAQPAGALATANAGLLSVADSGLSALVAPGAAHAGVINVKLGTVDLAAGSRLTVDFAGDNLISVAVGDKQNAAFAGKQGAGHVVLSTGAAKGLVDNLVNMSGVTHAASISVSEGKIVLGSR